MGNINQDSLSEFLSHLARNNSPEFQRVPSLSSLSKKLEISVSSLREQLEVARSLGLVEVRPKTGIRRLPYTFKPAVNLSLKYAVSLDPEIFLPFSDLRKRLEMAYWYEAVNHLDVSDHSKLNNLVNKAFERLKGEPIQIPHYEHRRFHLSIYSKINNVFVIGLLEAYWDIYTAVGLDIYNDLDYLNKVWDYHQKIAHMITIHDYEGGYWTLVEHFGMLEQRPVKEQQILQKSLF